MRTPCPQLSELASFQRRSTVHNCKTMCCNVGEDSGAVNVIEEFVAMAPLSLSKVLRPAPPSTALTSLYDLLLPADRGQA